MMKPLQPKGISVIVTGAGQTTWFATDFGVGRGVLVDEWNSSRQSLVGSRQY